MHHAFAWYGLDDRAFFATPRKPVAFSSDRASVRFSAAAAASASLEDIGSEVAGAAARVATPFCAKWRARARAASAAVAK